MFGVWVSKGHWAEDPGWASLRTDARTKARFDTCEASPAIPCFMSISFPVVCRTCLPVVASESGRLRAEHKAD
jgi:hypothetical protein